VKKYMNDIVLQEKLKKYSRYLFTVVSIAALLSLCRELLVIAMDRQLPFCPQLLYPTIACDFVLACLAFEGFSFKNQKTEIAAKYTLPAFLLFFCYLLQGLYIHYPRDGRKTGNHLPQLPKAEECNRISKTIITAALLTCGTNKYVSLKQLTITNILLWQYLVADNEIK
jgi:hypothetical protein